MTMLVLVAQCKQKCPPNSTYITNRYSEHFTTHPHTPHQTPTTHLTNILTLLYINKLTIYSCKLINFLSIDTPACQQGAPLGMEDRTLAAWQITASSHLYGFEPWRARLRGTRSWAAETQNPSSLWIQVEFMNIVVITGIQTQGGGYYWHNGTYFMNWVETLHVQYEDQPVWRYIMDGGREMVCVSLSE